MALRAAQTHIFTMNTRTSPLHLSQSSDGSIILVIKQMQPLKSKKLLSGPLVAKITVLQPLLAPLSGICSPRWPHSSSHSWRPKAPIRRTELNVPQCERKAVVLWPLKDPAYGGGGGGVQEKHVIYLKKISDEGSELVNSNALRWCEKRNPHHSTESQSVTSCQLLTSHSTKIALTNVSHLGLQLTSISSNIFSDYYWCPAQSCHVHTCMSSQHQRSNQITKQAGKM